jgi:hypothetical protein
MKKAKVGSEKIVKAAQPRRVAGVPVRSGIKAGTLGDSEFGSMRGGTAGDREFGSRRHQLG